MVKADSKCDYYADLELPPSAEANEIKRQFKKLALKYHPDRNPGKELEFNSKFQAIQAAHEVLTDPTQRAKYDADRIKNGLLHPYTSPLRPNPPPRAAASNFPPPPRRTPQASTRANFPPPSSGASRYSTYMQPDPNNAYKSPADDVKARANAFKAWEHMRHGQGVPPQGRPVPPRPTKNTGFQPVREAGSYPPQEHPQRPAWDHTKEPHPGLPKMARSNTTRVPKKGGFAPGFSAGDEPPARNTSAYYNVSQGERPDVSRSNFESRPPPPPPPAASSNQRSSRNRPEPLKPFKPQSGTEDLFANNERLSTPYATSGGEKTYFGTGFSRPTSARDSTASGDVYDSEPLGSRSPKPKNAPATPQRGHHSASPKLRSPRPVSISSTSSSSSDESLREGVEQLYTSAGKSRVPPNRNQNGHLRPNYRPFVSVDDTGEDKGLPRRSTSDATEGRSTSAQKPHSAGSNIDAGATEGFMEHRLKHEAERTQAMKDPPYPQSHASDASRSQQRPLHRPKSWHDKYGGAGQDQARDNLGRPATGDAPAKPSMYDASGFDPSFFTSSPSFHKSWYQQWPFGGSKPSSGAQCPKAPLPQWAIPSCIPPRRQDNAQEHTSIQLQHNSSFILPTIGIANKFTCDSFSFPNDTNGRSVHPPPLRSHSSDIISVKFSPSDWHGKFTGKPEEYFDPPTRKNNIAHGRTSPTKRQAPPMNPAPSVSSTEGSELPNGSSHMPPPPPPGACQEETYSPDKWAPYFKPGTLNWPPPPPPPVGAPVRGASRKRPKTPSRRGSKNVFKRPAVPKPASVTPVVDDTNDETTSSNLESTSSQSSGNGTPMDLDSSTSPPSGLKPLSWQRPSADAGASDSTPRPPIPPRATVPPRKPAPSDNSHLGLSDLKNVAPFAPNQEGLKDLNDLSTTLPFESRASTQPTKLPSPRKLLLPQPPKPPVAPKMLTQSSWDHYIAAMRAYVTGWNAFNAQILAHFNERQASVESTLKPEWMSAVGEGTEKWGFGKYMQGVEEDFRVREHWDLSWERHRECMRVLGVVREQLSGSSIRAAS
ncbi:MAG: hypothetical protein Q9166_001518 [cf. Caloplaca sp. 2 TL-2023]